MLLVRILLIIGLLGGVLYLSLNPQILRKSSVTADITNNITGSIKNQLTQASQRIPAIKNLQDILGITSTISQIDIKSINSGDIKKFAESLPSQIQEQLPKIEGLITNTKKEELYLKAPVSFSLPEIKIENYDQEITAELAPFELKNTKKNQSSWKLTISAGDLVSDKGRIGKNNIIFKFKKEYLEVLEGGNADELIIEDGKTLIISSKLGQGIGVFRIKPLVTVKIPQGSYSGTYKAELVSSLE